MRRQQIENAANDVATQVRTVEDSLDGALADLAELQGRMLRARAASNVSVTTGQSAFEQLSLVLQSLIAARGSLGSCHTALLDAQQFVPGLRTISFGDGSDCPKAVQADLRVVA
jgi:dGTP triphosphohydrolase